tara:strand:+ start:274 stop:456 length:183 start_codon:yes stop_codon:yes gene_type:complete
MVLNKEDVKIVKVMTAKRNRLANRLNYRRRQRILKQAAYGCWWIEEYFSQDAKYKTRSAK